MGQKQDSTMARKGSHLTRIECIQLEGLIKANIKTGEIAEIFGRSRRTIQRERIRGKVIHLDSELKEYETYSSDRSREVRRYNMTAKGPELKAGSDKELLSFISKQIVGNHFSPEVAVNNARKAAFTNCICTKTLYSYIDMGIIEGVTNKTLLEKSTRKTNKGKSLRKKGKTSPKVGHSINDRPPEVMERKEPGHWEIDLVVGGKGCSKHALLTIVERLSRRLFIVKIKDRSQASVIRALNGIERKMGVKKFQQTFKSITADNGSEFLDMESMQNSVFGNNKRTMIYYAHPYCSWQRGSNENANRIIRRFIPKGADISRYTRTYIQEVENWINDYPRKILGFSTANEIFTKAMAA